MAQNHINVPLVIRLSFIRVNCVNIGKATSPNGCSNAFTVGVPKSTNICRTLPDTQPPIKAFTMSVKCAKELQPSMTTKEAYDNPSRY